MPKKVRAPLLDSHLIAPAFLFSSGSAPHLKYFIRKNVRHAVSRSPFPTRSAFVMLSQEVSPGWPFLEAGAAREQSVEPNSTCDRSRSRSRLSRVSERAGSRAVDAGSDYPLGELAVLGLVQEH